MKAAQERYRQSYFDEFPDIWYHGDHVLITESRDGNGGGVIMLGRSDGVLYVVASFFEFAEAKRLTEHETLV